MTTWLIEPRDPLLFRDGRPFDTTPGVRAESLPFPFPSTVVGAARTRAGQDASGRFRATDLEALLRITLRGPLLVALDGKDNPTLLAPAPADALLLEGKGGCAERYPLVPLEPPDGAYVGRPKGAAETWRPTGLAKADSRKPLRAVPRFWFWKKLEEWLLAPSADTPPLADLGLSGPMATLRTHVSIDPATGRALEGMLFQTSGLEFNAAPWGSRAAGALPTVEALHRLALLAQVEPNGGAPAALRSGWSTLGGEQRAAYWRPSSVTLPDCPAEIAASIARSGHCRLVLLTPAHFERGAVPGWLLTARHGVTPTLRGMVVSRPQVVSGWDYQSRGPKPSRRLAPAGSVYFLTLDGSESDRRAWIAATWMQNVSDDEQARRDGFGLAALGTWGGQPLPMQEGAE